jgi:hypothetical protein
MPRLVDGFQDYAAPASNSAKPTRAQRTFTIPKLSVAERREFLDAFGPVLSLQEAAEIAGLAPVTLKKQLSQGKYANCVKRKKPIRFLTDRFIQELFRGAAE